MDARPEFPYLFAVLELWFAEGAAFVLVPLPRPKEAAGAHLPALLQGNPPSRALRFSLLRCGEHPRGYPDVAFGRCAGTLRPWGRERLLEVHVRKTRSPVIPARKGGIVRSDIRVPEAKRGRVPCRNEDDNRLSKRSKAEHCLFKRNRASPAEPSTPAFPSGAKRRKRA